MDQNKSLDKILKNKVFLLDTLSEEANLILQYVHQAKLITQREYRNLSDVSQREERIINLLDKLMSKGEETCCQFIKLLRQDYILENFPKLKNHAIFASLLPEVPLYKIEQIPRGICVIINNVNFMLAERRGSDKDGNDLAKVFRWLGFKVVEHKNKTAAEMKTILKDVGRTVDGDCFVCCVLSHGAQEGVYGTDDAIVSVNEIQEPFSDINCQRLVGKPKLFILQGSRQGNSIAMEANITVPFITDFLIAWSTTAGHHSYRDINEGTVFIQSICRNLRERCPLRTDILEILHFVKVDVEQMISKMEKLTYGPKQMPVYEVALSKKLILSPVSH